MAQGRRSNKEMAELLEQARSLARVNPTLSMSAIARHYGLAEATVAKWYSQGKMSESVKEKEGVAWTPYYDNMCLS
jgi:transposase-like protein